MSREGLIDDEHRFYTGYPSNQDTCFGFSKNNIELSPTVRALVHSPWVKQYRAEMSRNGYQFLNGSYQFVPPPPRTPSVGQRFVSFLRGTFRKDVKPNTVQSSSRHQPVWFSNHNSDSLCENRFSCPSEKKNTKKAHKTLLSVKHSDRCKTDRVKKTKVSKKNVRTSAVPIFTQQSNSQNSVMNSRPSVLITKQSSTSGSRVGTIKRTRFSLHPNTPKAPPELIRHNRYKEDVDDSASSMRNKTSQSDSDSSVDDDRELHQSDGDVKRKRAHQETQSIVDEYTLVKKSSMQTSHEQESEYPNKTAELSSSTEQSNHASILKVAPTISAPDSRVKPSERKKVMFDLGGTRSLPATPIPHHPKSPLVFEPQSILKNRQDSSNSMSTCSLRYESLDSKLNVLHSRTSSLPSDSSRSIRRSHSCRLNRYCRLISDLNRLFRKYAAQFDLTRDLVDGLCDEKVLAIVNSLCNAESFNIRRCHSASSGLEQVPVDGDKLADSDPSRANDATIDYNPTCQTSPTCPDLSRGDNPDNHRRTDCSPKEDPTVKPTEDYPTTFATNAVLQNIEAPRLIDSSPSLPTPPGTDNCVKSDSLSHLSNSKHSLPKLVTEPRRTYISDENIARLRKSVLSRCSRSLIELHSIPEEVSSLSLTSNHRSLSADGYPSIKSDLLNSLSPCLADVGRVPLTDSEATIASSASFSAPNLNEDAIHSPWTRAKVVMLSEAPIERIPTAMLIRYLSSNVETQTEKSLNPTRSPSESRSCQSFFSSDEEYIMHESPSSSNVATQTGPVISDQRPLTCKFLLGKSYLEESRYHSNADVAIQTPIITDGDTLDTLYSDGRNDSRTFPSAHWMHRSLNEINRLNLKPTSVDRNCHPGSIPPNSRTMKHNFSDEAIVQSLRIVGRSPYRSSGHASNIARKFDHDSEGTESDIDASSSSDSLPTISSSNRFDRNRFLASALSRSVCNVSNQSRRPSFNHDERSLKSTYCAPTSNSRLRRHTSFPHVLRRSKTSESPTLDQEATKSVISLRPRPHSAITADPPSRTASNALSESVNKNNRVSGATTRSRPKRDPSRRLDKTSNQLKPRSPTLPRIHNTRPWHRNGESAYRRPVDDNLLRHTFASLQKVRSKAQLPQLPGLTKPPMTFKR